MKKLYFRIQANPSDHLDHLFHVYYQVVDQFLTFGKVSDNYPLWILDEASKYCQFLENNNKQKQEFNTKYLNWSKTFKNKIQEKQNSSIIRKGYEKIHKDYGIYWTKLRRL